MFRRFFDFVIFSSFYIAACAVVMTIQTNDLLELFYNSNHYLLFVFFSTICSYNFHWYLTPQVETEMIRVKWTQHHKVLHLVLFGTGLIGSVFYFFYFIEHWFWLSGAVVLTFLYSAPKLTYGPFILLRKIAIGKTIFLAFVWMYVTTWLPLILGDKAWHTPSLLFCLSRFFLIYSICILFDYRDRTNDKKEGIKSMITYFDEKGINRLFYFSMLIFAVSTLLLYYFGINSTQIILILIPGIIVLALYPVAKRNFSDYLYYVVLDGLMMLSALLHLLIK